MEWELVLKCLSYFKSLETYKAQNEFEARVASFRSEFFWNTPGSGLDSARILWQQHTR
jgi:hypothetical protein